MAETISEARKWRLTYAIDGVPCYAELVEKGTRLTGLPRPSKPGCTFGGWGEVPSRMPGHDLTLDGHFIEKYIPRCICLRRGAVRRFGTGRGLSSESAARPGKRGVRIWRLGRFYRHRPV